MPEAAKAFEKFNAPMSVVKAQVYAGGRGKAGFVKLVKSAEEARQAAQFMLGNRMVSYQTGPARGLNFSVTAGAHALDAEEEGRDSETSFSLGLGAWHPELSGLKLFVGADVLGFTNPTTDGLLVTTRVGGRHGVISGRGGGIASRASPPGATCSPDAPAEPFPPSGPVPTSMLSPQLARGGRRLRACRRVRRVPGGHGPPRIQPGLLRRRAAHVGEGGWWAVSGTACRRAGRAWGWPWGWSPPWRSG